MTGGHPARGAPHPPQPRYGFGSRGCSPCRAPRCPQSPGEQAPQPPLSLPQSPPPCQALGGWLPASLPSTPPGFPYRPDPPPAPPSLPMFPSMEIFLRRFWKLVSRKPAGLWQWRLAGVDMAVPSGNSGVFPAAPAPFKVPAKRGAGWPLPAGPPREEAEALPPPPPLLPCSRAVTKWAFGK